MSPTRPDLVECWIFRVPPGGAPEFLLIRRAPDRIFPGLWQCVTGALEPGERVPLAALREVREEVGFGPAEIEAFYDLDQVTQFYDEGSDGIVAGAIFALRVSPDAEPRLSHEHDGARWAERGEAQGLVVWPTYRDTIERILGKLMDPDLERWFRLDPDGRRVAR
jgi:8-oxo-dGTP pyrophosphatase MutT (NUDIX family)